MKQRSTIIFLLTAVSLTVFSGWGKTGHSKINYFSTAFFPTEMNAFVAWNYSLSSHASDADNRKSQDPTEDIKHYIDIDVYTSFIYSGKISQDFANAIQSEGILPWATIWTVDSLTAQFKRRDFDKALLTASDLGHYVGDGHNPLHITKNFNKNSVHTPYETTMIDKYTSQIIIKKDTASYVTNVPDFIFNYLYENYKYCDSIFKADTYAYNLTNRQRTTVYYDTLWSQTKGFTLLLFNNASKRLGSLIYTAWVNAGKPDLNSSYVKQLQSVLNGFELYQNFPNPFNPETRISFSLPSASHVTLKLFDAAGREIRILLNEFRQKGFNEYQFNASELPAGIYFYNIKCDNYSAAKKMVLLK